MFIVTVTLTVKPDMLNAFIPLMVQNARSSLDEEPDCIRFDIYQSPTDLCEIFLHEQYTNQAAFDFHLQTPHYNAFDAAVRDMLTDKVVKTYTSLSSDG